MTQDGFAWRFDWGASGLTALAPTVDAMVIVDVLRFTTAVSMAIDGGLTIVPAPRPTEGPTAGPWALSGRWIGEHPPGSQLLLWSPNGGELARAAVDAGARTVVAAGLRNASAVARALVRLGVRTVAVIAAGETDASRGDGGWRPAVEDMLGAGAVLAALDPAGSISAPACSPEAAAARAAFIAARPRLADALAGCTSGRELAAKGFGDDLAAAAALDLSAAVPVLRDGVFVPL
jgi:2-phosphosulfolactate phosphatase